LIGFGLSIDYSQQSLNPSCQARCLKTHGPIASEHHTVPAKATDDVFDDWAQIIDFPLTAIRLRDYSRDFAHDIRKT